MLNTEFYPTPERLLCKITQKIDWRNVNTVLEPSAGKGDICDFIKERKRICYSADVDIDCVEIDETLRSTLIGKGYRVVHDDFLTYNTFKKYDLIIMNPPFSNGSKHLLKALELQKDGGSVVCILNADTIRNQCSNERIALVRQLENLNATIDFYEHEFSDAERKTDVAVAVVKVTIPKKADTSRIYEKLKQKVYGTDANVNVTEIAPSDFVEAIVQRYNIEVEAGVKLIKEYRGLCPYMNSTFDDACNSPILTLKIGKADLSINGYVRQVRLKYWSTLFNNSMFTGNMTRNLLSEYRAKVSTLADYDFSLYNIRQIQIEMKQNLIRGIEECIIEMFDKLSYQHSYDNELSNNIHYYNGWKTNKSWIINKKVIMPWMNAWDSIFNNYCPTDYQLVQNLKDIEKALNYLDGGLTDARDMDAILKEAEETGQTKKIQLKYFNITFFKKGTCHIEFTNLELLKKLNIFGSQKKRWLPSSYGKKGYEEMNAEEKAVIDAFEGKEEYQKTLINSSYYLYSPEDSFVGIEMKESA